MDLNQSSCVQKLVRYSSSGNN